VCPVSAVETAVAALLPVIVTELEKLLPEPAERDIAAALLADRLKLRAGAQALLDARRRGLL
jgi:hypothetical protein